jgi:hypothetical protein
MKRRDILPMLAIVAFLVGCDGVTPTHEPSVCTQDPGVPVPGFNQCGSAMAEWLLSPEPSPNAIRFAITARHAVWWDERPAPLHNSLFFVDHGASCSAKPSPPKEVTQSTNTEAQDAVTNSGNPQESYVYFDNQGKDLRGAILPSNVNFAPLPSATADQMFPGGSDPMKGFAWQEDGDIWICLSLECNSGDTIRITQTSDRENHPRMYGDHVVWENTSLGQVMYAKGPTYTPVTIDQGSQPDVYGDWIVYAKREPSPNPACSWSHHWQLWAYGPLSNNPGTMRLSGVSYWGAANYIAPRLTDDYVVFLVDYLFHPKTVVGIYPISGFGKTNVPMLEVDDGGDASGNVDAWQESSTVVHVLYRDRYTRGAKLRCCWP